MLHRPRAPYLPHEEAWQHDRSGKKKVSSVAVAATCSLVQSGAADALAIIVCVGVPRAAAGSPGSWPVIRSSTSGVGNVLFRFGGRMSAAPRSRPLFLLAARCTRWTP